MGALKVIAAISAVAVAQPAAADEVGRWHPLIAEASIRFGIPSTWIERVMRAESRGQTEVGGVPIRSPKGAIGLMQLMPGTWAEIRSRLKLGSDPDDPRDNILAGAFYLRQLYDRFGYPGLFAAYNAGPGRYEKYLSGTPLPAETRAYLASITDASILPQARTAPPLFVGGADVFDSRGSGAHDPAGAGPGPIDPLFAVRNDPR